MLLNIFRSFTIRFLFVFILGFTLTLPQSYYLFPNTGEWFKPFIEKVVAWIFTIETADFYSDSTVMWCWVLILTLFSFFISMCWSLFKLNASSKLYFSLHTYSAHYLALTLFIYGFNKVFNYQFYPPEPNILYTRLGALSPDILYWSTMGTSYSYSIFAGLIELIPAFLLLFRKTRMLGACIALGVLINVTMINVGFGITVKIYSFFLLLICIVILSPYVKRLYLFFLHNKLNSEVPTNSPFLFIPSFLNKNKNMYPALKSIIIALLLFESLGMYFEVGYFKGSNIPKPPMHGAYSVNENSQKIKYIFFHSKGYFILLDEQEKFYDYPYHLSGTTIQLENYLGEKCQLQLTPVDQQNYRISGAFFGVEVYWELEFEE